MAIVIAADAVELLLAEGPEAAMRQYNGNTTDAGSPPSEGVG